MKLGTMGIGSCEDIEVPITLRTRDTNRLRQTVRADKRIELLPQFTALVPWRIKTLPQGRHFIFESLLRAESTVATHIVSANTVGIPVVNSTDNTIVIPKRRQIGTVE